MKFILKYGIGIYLMVTLLFKLAFIVPHDIVNAIYYFLMAVGVLIIPLYSKVLFSKRSLTVFWPLHAVNLLNLAYLLLFTPTSIDGWLYFLTKLAAFNLIILGLIYNYNFYKESFLKYFKYIMLLMLVFGTFFGGVEADNSGRLSIGFNPNDVGLFGLMGLFAIITFNRQWAKSKLDLAFVIVFFIFALLSGSKATLLGIGLVGFMNYGVTFKSVGLAILAIAGIFIISNFGYKTSFDRLMSKDGAFETRDEVYKNGMLTFNEQPVFGHGLDKYGWSNPKYFANPEEALGPHNTYISIGIMYGLFFGIIFLLIIFRFLFKTRSRILRGGDEFTKFSYYFLCLIMIIGFFETLIVGVNETMTLQFWFCLSVVAYNYSLNKKNVFSHKAV
jgi:O-antigen ligase